MGVKERWRIADAYIHGVSGEIILDAKRLTIDRLTNQYVLELLPVSY